MQKTTEEIWEMRDRAFALLDEVQRHLASEETLSSEDLDDMTDHIRKLHLVIDLCNDDLGLPRREDG